MHIDRFKRLVNSLVGGMTLLCICALFLGCKDANPAKPAPPQEVPKTFIGKQKLSISHLSKNEWFGVLESVDAHDLFAYLTGGFGGSNSFPVIYLDPAKQSLWVRGPEFQLRFNGDELDKALKAYFDLLVKKGYPIPGENKPEQPTVTIDGKEMVIVTTQELFPSTKDAQSHFSGEQWNVLYSELGGWEGFSYLSGVGTKSRDYPLLVGLGWEDSARLRLLSKRAAAEFKFDQVDEAFEAYREVVSQRLPQPAKPKEDSRAEAGVESQK